MVPLALTLPISERETNAELRINNRKRLDADLFLRIFIIFYKDGKFPTHKCLSEKNFACRYALII
jgi:hypothetical protein